jgi:DNA-binding helix-hairpin-helix protein with protein kinase domain
MVMPPKKPVTQSVDTPPPDRSSAAFISYVYSHKRTAPLPETPRSTPLKGPKKTAG